MTTSAWFTPAKESLLFKRTGLEQQVLSLEDGNPTPQDLVVLKRCRETLAQVAALDAGWRPSHPHLAWRLLHRAARELLLVLPGPELLAAAQRVRDAFDLNVTEAKVREAWLGDGAGTGLLTKAVAQLRADPADAEARHLLRQAAAVVDDQVDGDFWNLSMNTLTGVLSGVALGLAMVAFAALGYAASLPSLGGGALDGSRAAQLSLLGLMGGYLSNALTREGFLYLRGGPFWRYFALHLAARPVLSAFAAVALAILVKAELVVAFNAAAGRAGVVSIQVGEPVGYAYAGLAIAAGFAADKLLRDMLGRVLARLEQKAEKTKASTPAPAAGAA